MTDGREHWTEQRSALDVSGGGRLTQASRGRGVVVLALAGVGVPRGAGRRRASAWGVHWRSGLHECSGVGVEPHWCEQPQRWGHARVRGGRRGGRSTAGATTSIGISGTARRASATRRSRCPGSPGWCRSSPGRVTPARSTRRAAPTAGGTTSGTSSCPPRSSGSSVTTREPIPEPVSRCRWQRPWDLGRRLNGVGMPNRRPKAACVRSR